MSALTEVIRTGSFERAAERLSVTPSAISQRVKALEERIGSVLIMRGQPCLPTPTGQRILRHAEEVDLLEQMLHRDLGGAAPALSTLRVAVNADSLATWLIPGMAACDGILFDLVIDDQDHSAAWLREGKVSAAITSHAAPVQGCDSHPLAVMRYVATASPAFMARWFPDGVTVEALKHAPMMTFDPKDTLQTDWLRATFGRPLRPPSHWIPATHPFVEATLAGMGWAMNPEILIADHLATGRLVPLMPEAPLDVPLHWQTSRMVGKAIAPITREIRRAASVLRPFAER